MMNYKKPAFWTIAAAVLICAVTLVYFAANHRAGAPVEADSTTEALNYKKLPVLDESRAAQPAMTGEAAGITQGFYRASDNTGTDIWDYFAYGNAGNDEEYCSYIVIGGIKYDLGFVGYGVGGTDKNYLLKNYGLKSTDIKWDTPIYQLNRAFGLDAMTTSYLTIEKGIPCIIFDTSGWGEQYDLDGDGTLETVSNIGAGTAPDYVIYEWEQSSGSIGTVRLTEVLDCDVVTYLADENLFHAANWDVTAARYVPAPAYGYRDGKLILRK